MITLVLGGARSGKSQYAEKLSDIWLDEGEDRTRHYIATAQAFDDEMRARIARHKERRTAQWVTHEEPFALTDTLNRHAASGRFLLVDCLTLWLTNHLLAEHSIDDEIAALCNALQDMPGHIVLVANEVGLGIVPENKLARAFRDHAGLCNQKIAQQADQVVFIAAGLPLRLKGNATGSHAIYG